MTLTHQVTTSVSPHLNGPPLVTILRAFEAARKDLSIRTRGAPGAFPGFFRLDVHPLLNAFTEVSETVLTTVEMTEQSARFAKLAFLATLDRKSTDRRRPEVLASGTGVTIYPGSVIDTDDQLPHLIRVVSAGQA